MSKEITDSSIEIDYNKYFSKEIVDIIIKCKNIEKSCIGTKEESYNISINTNDKIIKHNCHDFETRRSQEKKFCKHLVKLFFLLKDENQEQTEQFLSRIGENIDDWDFTA